MNATTKLLLSSKNNILVNTQLAAEIGLNEAIVLRQVYYWVEHYETEKKNFIDGKYWVYNSMKQWRSDNFPFMSEKTIERAFSSLRKKNLILVGDYSKDRMKRPNWYTINDKEFDKLIKKITGTDDVLDEQEEGSEETNKENDANSLNAVGQNDCMQFDTPTDCYNIYNNINNTDTENTNRDYSTENTDKYALKDVKKSSFKGNMYASVPEEQEAVAPKKKSRYIPKNYTEEQLREHIKPVIESEVKQYIQDMDIKFPDGTANEFSDILCLFCQRYKQSFGENHYVMPDKTLKSAVRRYLEPPEEMDGTFGLDEYKELIDLYFKTDFNKRGNYDGKIVLSFPHFMSDTIRGNLANRLWK